MILNKLKTVFLLGALSGILLLIGTLFGGATGLQIAVIMALIMNFIAYFFSETIVLKLYKAQPLDPEEFKWIYSTVHSLAQTMSIPSPKLWLIKTPMANAFATGRNPRHASIAITTGILKILDHDELRGVLAHELSHIKNYDVLISTIAATIATAISYLAQMLQYAAFWQTTTTNDSDSKNRRLNPISMILIAIITPFVATLLQLAISRSREYLADETGAQHSHEPLALASALQKIHDNTTTHQYKSDLLHEATSSLFIIRPLSARSLNFLFSTHPPVEKRIEKLRKMFNPRF